jgi:hypothetical protein
MKRPLPAKVGTNFADKRRSLGLYSSLADYGHGVFFLLKSGWHAKVGFDFTGVGLWDLAAIVLVSQISV